MDPQDVVTIRNGIADKYRKVAVSPEGLFRYPTGEKSARGLDYPSDLIARIPQAIRFAPKAWLAWLLYRRVSAPAVREVRQY